MPKPRQCSVSGCDSPHYAKNLCSHHYRQARAGKKFETVATTSFAAPVVAADKRRCRFVMKDGKRCVRPKAGAAKFCSAHMKEAADMKAASCHDWEISLPAREPHEFLGDEESLVQMCEQRERANG